MIGEKPMLASILRLPSGIRRMYYIDSSIKVNANKNC
jgi:hypothetical protein